MLFFIPNVIIYGSSQSMLLIFFSFKPLTRIKRLIVISLSLRLITQLLGNLSAIFDFIDDCLWWNYYPYLFILYTSYSFYKQAQHSLIIFLSKMHRMQCLWYTGKYFLPHIIDFTCSMVARAGLHSHCLYMTASTLKFMGGSLGLIPLEYTSLYSYLVYHWKPTSNI